MCNSSQILKDHTFASAKTPSTLLKTYQIETLSTPNLSHTAAYPTKIVTNNKINRILR